MSEFSYNTAQRGGERLLLGIAGFSHSGKTYSALRLATGAQRVYGGDIAVIDSEESVQMYADNFTFKHIPFAPPHSADRWEKALKFAVDKGARVIILDTLSDEHHYLMAEVDKILDRMAGDDWAKRLRCGQVAHAKVKPARHKMERELVRSSKDVCIIVVWRADDKYTPKVAAKGEKTAPEDERTWKLESTSKLFYSCTIRWLLTPGSDGVPTLVGRNDDEKMLIKVPGPFRGMQLQRPLDEELGEKIARAAKLGNKSAPRQQAGDKFHRDYADASGPIEQGTPEQRIAYLAWLEAREVPANLRQPFEQHKALVQRMVERDLGNEAAQ